MANRLSLIAGSGALVPHVIDAARAAGFDLQVLSLGSRDDLADYDTIRIDLGQPQSIIAAIRAFGATHVTMAGGLHISDAAREGLARFAGGGLAHGAASAGDGALSGLAVALSQMTGARLVGPHEVAPDLLAPEDQLAGPPLTDAQLETARFALDLARKIGALDIGQAVVVAGRRVIAVEDVGGTDALLMRVAQYRQRGFATDGASSVVLAKAAKPQQPMFVDLPAIGPDTIDYAVGAGVEAIAVQAGKSLLIGRTRLVEAATAAGIALVGLAASDA